jgi:predicted DNA-binding transcriptional regulator AlpA
MCCGAPYDRIVTDAQVARRLGVPRGRVAELAREPGFPAPVGRITEQVPLWRWSEVRTWARRREAAPAA